MSCARVLVVQILVTALLGCAQTPPQKLPTDPTVSSLDELTVEFLRDRAYGSTINIEYAVQDRPSPSYIASYESDGLHVYARIDIPTGPPPESGFPVLMFVHGWMGIADAPSLNFYYDGDSHYSRWIDAYVEAGFAVFVPGWRGHGTINGRPAEGIEFMQAWDNGSYISPVFYAIDVVNLLDSLESFSEAPIDLEKVHLWGHSQGGDVALQVLAITGEGSAVNTQIQAASIWSGNIPSRLTQLETFWPMQTSPEAFMSGDGTWTGTAEGAYGSVNPNFVFGYPPDWIGTVNANEWTWQHETFSNATVADALMSKLDQMYAAINANVEEFDGASYELKTEIDGKVRIVHDPSVIAGVSRIGAFASDEFLTETLLLHHSDRDFYSFPEWNSDLCKRLNEGSGNCLTFTYPGNTHSLDVSEHEWFSPPDSVPGFSVAIQRDIGIFQSKNSR